MLVTNSGRAIRFCLHGCGTRAHWVLLAFAQGRDKIVSVITRHFEAESEHRISQMPCHGGSVMQRSELPAGNITQERYAEMSAAEI
jgi:hypothetical protein